MESHISWTEWFAIWWGIQESTDDFTKSQLSLDDGWRIIESEADKVLAEETEKEAEHRKQEVEKLSELAKQNLSSINWRRIFANVIEVAVLLVH